MLRDHLRRQRPTGSDVPPARLAVAGPALPKTLQPWLPGTAERMRSIAVNAVGRFLRRPCSKLRFPVVSSAVLCCVFGVFHGPPRQLERLSATFTGDLPGRFVSGNLGYREGLLQP